jgi:hypothetical protein
MGGLESKHIALAQVADALLDPMILAIEAV